MTEQRKYTRLPIDVIVEIHLNDGTQLYGETADISLDGAHDVADLDDAIRAHEALPAPWRVIPGNHDAYVHSAWSSTFSLWEPFMRSDAAGAGSDDSMFPSLRIRNGVALIGLSSARATAPFLATGALGRAQLQRLQALLEQAAEQRLFRVVLLHHPPRPEDEKWRKRLTDGKALCAVLGRAGAELVLHGHSHRSLHGELDAGSHRIPVFGIPSASAIGSREGRCDLLCGTACSQ